ncbi:monooxygenase [Fomitopsis serialis]|uniref:monooxygenase n=1 Tax=Fomitopsis serialis TaxID=139415 RepID=UPI0020089F27|nr:monooxygenase [Neoantrodia serialis]KAH9910479.1 monooxygenase [Neoantrodia serialis]
MHKPESKVATTGMNVDVPILIAGAGPAGLVLALALIQNGVKVRIIDKEPFYRPGQRGMSIQPRTLEIFNYLGVVDDILAKAIDPPRQRRVYKLPGGVEPLKTINIVEYDEPTPSTPIPNGVHLGQENSEAILRAHLAKYDCSVELGTALRDFEQHTDHVVAHIVKKDGEIEKTETVTCHFLVGTDGGRGVTRKKLGLTFQGETRARHNLVSEIEIFGLDRDYWHLWGNMSTLFCMILPTENPNSFYVVLSGQIDHERLASGREEILKTIRAATDRQDLQFGQLQWMADARANIRMANKFQEGRGFIAGDAAHVHSPTGGQGLNSSVQDSFNLAWKLALVEKGWASPDLLNTYTEERLPVIAAMLEQSTTLLNALETSTPDDTDDAAWKRDRQLKQLGVNYRWSSIVVDGRAPEKPKEPANVYGGETGGDLRAGDRAPDAPGLVSMSGDKQESLSLFRIFRPVYHTVLLFTSDSSAMQPVLEELRRYPAGSLKTVMAYPRDTAQASPEASADITVVDKEGHAFSAYGVSPDRPTIVAIRPDGVVGAIVFGVDGLKAYLEAVFSAI